MNSIALATEKMIAFYKGNLHDINHFLKVYALAKTIGEQEQLSKDRQMILELAAIVHDIACPLCRERYGSTNGKLQEKEGAILARPFLTELDCPQEIVERVCFLVAHHHTVQKVDGPDYQILLEADFLVNAHEGRKSPESMRTARMQIFKTAAGLRLLDSMYLLEGKQAEL